MDTKHPPTHIPTQTHTRARTACDIGCAGAGGCGCRCGRGCGYVRMDVGMWVCRMWRAMKLIDA